MKLVGMLLCQPETAKATEIKTTMIFHRGFFNYELEIFQCAAHHDVKHTFPL